MGFWDEGFGFIVGILIVIAIILAILIPLALIWALNTLFHMGIEMTFWTWLAMFILLLVIGSIVSSARSGCD